MTEVMSKPTKEKRGNKGDQKRLQGALENTAHPTDPFEITRRPNKRS
jgi:hypothetical protein